MRIAVIGAGAMGSIYGGHLSLHNDVYLVDTNPNVVAAVHLHRGDRAGRLDHPVR